MARRASSARANRAPKCLSLQQMRLYLTFVWAGYLLKASLMTAYFARKVCCRQTTVHSRAIWPSSMECFFASLESTTHLSSAIELLCLTSARTTRRVVDVTLETTVLHRLADTVSGWLGELVKPEPAYDALMAMLNILLLQFSRFCSCLLLLRKQTPTTLPERRLFHGT